MSKLTRQTFKQFGVSGPSSDFCQFGSIVDGSGIFTQNIATLQANTAWLDGFADAVYPSNSAPFLEEVNGLFYVIAYMLAYLFQSGTPEWDASTTYFTGSVVMDASGLGQRFISLQDSNLNNALPVASSNAFWQWDNPPLPTVPGFGNSLKASLLVTWNTTTRVTVSAALASVKGVVFPNSSIAAISQQANIATVGAGGLDTGLVSANKWYAVHLITNAAGTLLASMFSLSGTAPTMPSGYTLFRRVGWVRTGATSNILNFTQTGDWVIWADATSFTFSGISGAGTSFATCVPTTSQMFKISSECTNNDGLVTWKPTGSSAPAYHIARRSGSQSQVWVGDLPLGSAQQADIVSTTLWVVVAIGYYDPV